MIWRCRCLNCGRVYQEMGPGGPSGIGPSDPLPWDGTTDTCYKCRPDLNTDRPSE